MDMAYNNPIALEVPSISSESITLLKINHSVFLWSELYSRFPLQFSKPNSKGETGISELESGPLIHLSLGDTYSQLDKIRIGQGWLGFPHYFVNPLSDQTYKPGEEIKTSFRMLKKLFQNFMTRKRLSTSTITSNSEFQIVNRNLWFCPEALELFLTGEYYIRLGFEFWITRTDLE
jgi:hypothetical protein